MVLAARDLLTVTLTVTGANVGEQLETQASKTWLI